MLNLDAVIQNIVTDLEALEWGTLNDETSFTKVFDAPIYAHDFGSPFACVFLAETNTSNVLNTYVDVDNLIQIDICYTWAINPDSTDSAKLQTAHRKLNRAWTALRDHAMKDSTITAWIGNNQSGWTRNFSQQPNQGGLDQMNIIRKTFRLSIKDFVNRGAT